MLLVGSLFPSWQDFQPFLITGLALGAVYALSGVGMVVLYRATGVLYLAFGAVGAFGALIAWQLTQSHWNIWLAYLVAVVLSALITLAYGMVFGSALAAREPLVKATATLGLTLILLGAMDLLWTSSGGASRAILLPTDNHGFTVGEIEVTTTQVICHRGRDRDHGRNRSVSAVHQARHDDAGDGQRPGDHGDARSADPARRGVPPGSAAACSPVSPEWCSPTSSRSTRRR